ncbi:MAG: hypothetical protein ACJ76J_17180 [Thermoanaerobaculia bacterium]
MNDPEWLVRSLFPAKKRVVPRAPMTDRPPPLAPRPGGEARRPLKRPPLPRRSGPKSPFHP